MSDELKPCPFCGSSDHGKPWHNESGQYWSVICEQCVSEGPTADTRQEAIAAWSTRARGEAQ